MKSKLDFTDIEHYWEYVHTQTTINVMCVLVSKPQWKDYKAAAIEAGRIADAIVDVLKKKAR